MISRILFSINKMIYVVLLVTCIVQTKGKSSVRIVGGRDAEPGEYPFVVSLHRWNARRCSASVITSSWVLTAGHCCQDEIRFLKICFGNMSTGWAHDERKVLRLVVNPGYIGTFLKVGDLYFNDICLIETEEIPIRPLGRLSALEYTNLIGLPVIYVGYGRTKYNATRLEDYYRPPQIGEAGVIPCDEEVIGFRPSICVVPKCKKLYQFGYSGDSGGPLLYKNYIVGVFSGTNSVQRAPPRYMMSEYTPVSPYLDWIESVIHENNRTEDGHKLN